MKLRKKMVTLLAMCLILTATISIPTVVAEAASATTSVTISQGVSTRALYKLATYTRRKATYRIPNLVNLTGRTLTIYIPKNSNLTLFQGELTFKNGTTTITKPIANYGLETWTFNSSDVGSGLWTVTLTGSAVGTRDTTVYYEN